MRRLEPEMLLWIDRKLKDYGAAQDAIQRKDARSVFFHAAEACIGIREQGGNNQGPLVRLIQETVGRAQGEPWCMSFVQTCLAYAENKTGVKSPLMATEHCMTLFNNTDLHQRVKFAPLRGAIIIWRKGNTASGHTGIFIETDVESRTFTAIEGNTEKGVSNGKVVRDGGGVYLTKRSHMGTGNMRIMGFIKPF